MECGYDAFFISDIPDYLRCVVCQLVLRNPLQVLTCGHKFCAQCFERLKVYANNTNIVLRCPVDRDVIDASKVCEDNGMNRVVGNLLVRCANNETGCSWQGDLRDMKAHEVKCEHRVVKSKQSSIYERDDEMSTMLKQMNERLGRCEETLTNKEKDNAFLKYNLQEMKTRFNEKLTEVDVLKAKNTNLEHELKVMKRQQQQSSNQAELKMEELSLKNIILEEKVESLENQLLLANKQLEGNQLDIVTMQGEVENIKCSISKGSETLETSNKLHLKTNTLASRVREALKAVHREEEANKIVIRHHRGNPKDVTISGHHNVEFKAYSTAVAPSAVVPSGKKSWYEVTFEDKEINKHSFSQIGWATSEFESLQEYSSFGVGDCSHSYGFDGQGRYKYHSGPSLWGKQFGAHSGRVLGVAADMINGKLLFSLDGEWKDPMGVAFNSIDKEVGLFPALTGKYMKLSVNFGDRDFQYGPPDSSFEKLKDVRKMKER